MRTIIGVLYLLVLSDGTLFAQTETVMIARMGVARSGPTYHFVEVFQIRDGWILSDVGWIDFSTSDYGEAFAGIGRVMVKTSHITLINELYIAATVGSASQGAIYIQPWTLVAYTVSSKLAGEAVAFPYVPLNKQARKQWVIERIKLEYDLGLIKVGGGYGAYQFADEEWQHRPFVSVTARSSKLGDLEVWWQHLPQTKVRDDGSQIQLRFSKTIK